MKVIMLTEYPLHVEEASAGGIMQSTYQLISGLSESLEPGSTLQILTLHNEIQSTKTNYLSESVNVTYLTGFRGGIMGFVSGLVSYFRILNILIKEKDAIIHAQGAVKYLVLSAFFPSRAVFTIHGIYRNELKVQKDQSILKKLKNKIKILAETWYMKRLKYLFCISGEIQEIVTKLNPDAEILPVNNPIDDKFFEVPLITKHNPSRIQLLFVAAITPRKGLDVLLNALNSAEIEAYDFELTIAGIESWYPQYIYEIKEFVKASGLRDNVNFLGEVTQAELIKLYTDADLFILPSLAESAPMVISQSLAMGIPVLASSVGEIPNMVSEGVDGFLVKSGSVEELRNAILSVLKGQRSFTSKTEIRTSAEKKYRLSAVSKMTVEHYKLIEARGIK